MLAMNTTYSQVINRICEDVQKEMASKSKENGDIDWTVDTETLFFYALFGHKPVGVNRHFMMVLIQRKFSAFLNREIPSKVLWDHLDSMYDMAALHESENLPFPNDEVDFELPEDCYELLHAKHGVNLKKNNSESESSKTIVSCSKSSKKLTPKVKHGASGNTAKKSFASPMLSKPVKSQTSVKAETKASSSDAVPKVKETGLLAKSNKIKYSSSPSGHKIKSDATIKEGSRDSFVSKKSNKLERGNSPAILKKPVKTESTPTSSSSKKLIKGEAGVIRSKPIKSDTLDNSVKRERKVDKDVSKKGKTPSPVEVFTKKHKVDVPSLKKKTESESSSRKSSESFSEKSFKEEVKLSHLSREIDLASFRRTSPVVKLKCIDGYKRLKSPKEEEPPKKLSTPGPKRRDQPRRDQRQ